MITVNILEDIEELIKHHSGTSFLYNFDEVDTLPGDEHEVLILKSKLRSGLQSESSVRYIWI